MAKQAAFVSVLLLGFLLGSCGHQPAENGLETPPSGENQPNGPTIEFREEPKSVDSYQFRSRVLYESAAEDPHRFQITIGFPDYARIRLASDPQSQGRRTLTYLNSGRAYSIPQRSAKSVEFEGEKTLQVRLWVQLRHALCRWEQSRGWVDDLGNPQQKKLDLPGLGHLDAQFSAGNDFPHAIRAFDTSGELELSFENIVWSAEPMGSKRPTGMSVANRSGPAWNEDQIEIRSGLRMLPDFYLPSDRRAPSNRLQGQRTLSK